MPTLNPRITITLRPELHSILKRLSSLTSQSQSAIVSDLLESSMPVFERMAAMLEAANRLKSEGMKGADEIRESLGIAQNRLESQLDLALLVMDQGAKPLLDRAGDLRAETAAPEGATPVPVTRGSGTTRSGKKWTGRGVGRGKV